MQARGIQVSENVIPAKITQGAAREFVTPVTNRFPIQFVALFIALGIVPVTGGLNIREEGVD